MRNRMYGKRNAILHSDFAHEFGHVGLYSTLFNAQH